MLPRDEAQADGAAADAPAAASPLDDPVLRISRSNAIIPLLLIFGATVIGIFVAIVRADPFVPPHGAAADRAYRPAEFPAIFGHDEALTGLSVAARPEGGAAALFPVPAPPFSEGVFPCSECHKDLTPDPTRRKLDDMHDDIVLAHDEEHRWCLDCHDATNRDKLRLASGELVDFTESYRLCGQCHGTQFRDWRSGIHGKRTGFWNGPKRYLLCVHCHNPHRPRFAPMKPLPPPVRPQLLRGDQGGPKQ
jgi:hypothetical protein